MGNSELGVGEKRKRESLLKENGAFLQQWGEETSLCLMGHLLWGCVWTEFESAAHYLRIINFIRSHVPIDRTSPLGWDQRAIRTQILIV